MSMGVGSRTTTKVKAAPGAEAVLGEDSEPKPKRKRAKKRSKQKNLRKDTRPAHLVG